MCSSSKSASIITSNRCPGAKCDYYSRYIEDTKYLDDQHRLSTNLYMISTQPELSMPSTMPVWGLPQVLPGRRHHLGGSPSCGFLACVGKPGNPDERAAAVWARDSTWRPQRGHAFLAWSHGSSSSCLVSGSSEGAIARMSRLRLVHRKQIRFADARLSHHHKRGGVDILCTYLSSSSAS